MLICSTSVSKSTILRNFPKPVKYAFEWVDLLLPSITSIDFAWKPVWVANFISLSLSSPSSKGVSLLNRGSINFGHKIKISNWTEKNAQNAKIHQKLGKIELSNRNNQSRKPIRTNRKGKPIRNPLILSVIQSCLVDWLNPYFCSTPNCLNQSKNKSGTCINRRKAEANNEHTQGLTEAPWVHSEKYQGKAKTKTEESRMKEHISSTRDILLFSSVYEEHSVHSWSFITPFTWSGRDLDKEVMCEIFLDLKISSVSRRKKPKTKIIIWRKLSIGMVSVQIFLLYPTKFPKLLPAPLWLT